MLAIKTRVNKITAKQGSGVKVIPELTPEAAKKPRERAVALLGSPLLREGVEGAVPSRRASRRSGARTRRDGETAGWGGRGDEMK